MKRMVFVICLGLLFSVTKVQDSMSHCNTSGTNGWCNYYSDSGGGNTKKCENFRKEGEYNGKCLYSSGGGGELEPVATLE